MAIVVVNFCTLYTKIICLIVFFLIDPSTAKVDQAAWLVIALGVTAPHCANSVRRHRACDRAFGASHLLFKPPNHFVTHCATQIGVLRFVNHIQTVDAQLSSPDSASQAPLAMCCPFRLLPS